MDPGTLVGNRRVEISSRFRLLLLIPTLSLLPGCDPKEKVPSVPPAHIVLSHHPKAVAAAERVRASLDHDLSKMGLRLGDPIFIRAFKEEKLVELFVKRPDAETYKLFRTYPIAAASGTLGPKLAEGDGQVPEGFYSVTPDGMNPDSRFNLSFNVGFPNAYDQFHNRTGSLIMLHGNEVSIGCLAMTDAKIDEIFTFADAALRNSQPNFPVHFFPFRMTADRMEKAMGDVNDQFWRNLKEGYDLFEQRKIPPQVELEEGQYVFR